MAATRRAPAGVTRAGTGGEAQRAIALHPQLYLIRDDGALVGSVYRLPGDEGPQRAEAFGRRLAACHACCEGVADEALRAGLLAELRDALAAVVDAYLYEERHRAAGESEDAIISMQAEASWKAGLALGRACRRPAGGAT